MIVVSNATPLIALAKIGQLNLLQELFGAITIPQAGE
jgi:predicted nucleic acid-binding protein